LAQVLPPETLVQMLDQFIARARARPAELRALYAGDDRRALRQAGHHDVAEAAYLGAEAASEAARAMEAACTPNAAAAEVGAAVERYIAAQQAVIPEIVAWRERLRPG
jgi:HPt (histidine-containing phosphotransfer) domain-containing protein